MMHVRVHAGMQVGVTGPDNPGMESKRVHAALRGVRDGHFSAGGPAVLPGRCKLQCVQCAGRYQMVTTAVLPSVLCRAATGASHGGYCSWRWAAE